MSPAISRHRLFSLFFVLLLVTVGGIIAIETATAQTVEREGNTLVVSELNESTEDVLVTYENLDLEADSRVTSGEARFQVPSRSQVGDQQLINRTIRITQYDDFANESSIADDRVHIDLHSINFEQQSPIWVDSDENVRLPLDRQESAGIEDGDTVDVGGIAGEVLNDENQIKVDRNDLENNFNDMDQVEIEGVAINGEGSVTETPIEVSPEIRDDGVNRFLWHPLISEGAEFTISFQDTEDIATTAQAPGKVSLPSERETELSILEVINADDELLLNRSDQEGIEFEGHNEITAAISEDSERLQFEGTIVDYPIDPSAIVIETGEELIFESDSIQTNEPIGSDTQLTQNNSLLVQSSSGILQIQIEASDESGLGLITFIGAIFINSSIFLIPILLGGVMGIVYPITINVSGEKKDYLINVFIVLAITLVVYSIIHFITALSILEILIPPSVEQLLAILGIILSPIGTILLQKRFSESQEDTENTTGHSTTKNTFASEITIQGLDSFNEPMEVRFDPDDMLSNSRSEIQSSSVQRFENLSKDMTYTVNVSSVGQTDIVATKTKINANSPNASIEFRIPFNISVSDPEGQPIPNVEITSGEFETRSTSQDGTISTKLLPCSGSIQCTLSHPKYQTKSVNLGIDEEHYITLEPKTGDIDISITLDQDPVSDIPIIIAPISSSDMLKRTSDRFRSEVGGNLIKDKIIGDYEVYTEIQKQYYQNDSQTVSVDQHRTARCNLDIPFTWSLDSKHRERITTLRSRIDDLSQKRDQDTVIHEYYGSVIEEFLQTVEEIPQQGELFLNYNATPDEVADQLLTVAERIVEIFEQALSTKRNVDLFAACADMPSERIKWNGHVDLEEVVGRLENTSSNSRGEVQERFEEIENGTIKRNKKELTEIEPISEVHQRSLELINNTNNNNDLSISAYGTLIVLNAVEQAFEHNAIRERLSKTVF